MKIGISQPTFLPWCGYIALIDHVDEFVFLDNVQFEKRSWQQRNYIKVQNKKFLLTIPVLSKGLRFQNINNTKIDYSGDFIKKHINTLLNSYSKTKYFDRYSKEIFKIYEEKNELISDLNISLIKYFCKILDIKTKFDFSSNLNTNNKGENLIVEICKKKNCTKYVSTIGAKKYIKNKNLFNSENMKLSFFNFNNTEYNQRGNNFIQNLSFIDLFFNLGSESITYLRNNLQIIDDE